MPSRMKLVVGVMAIALVGAVSLALAAKPSNGNFEKGTLRGWKAKTLNDGFGEWAVYQNGDKPGDNQPTQQPPVRYAGRGDAPSGPGNLYAPPQGKFAAYGFGAGGGPRTLTRTLYLKPDRKITLSMKVFYKNLAHAFHTPNTLDTSVGGPTKNQQYRIDIIRKGAPLDSLGNSDVLQNVFRTKVGDKLKRGPFDVTANLTSLAGKTVTLRLAEVDTQYFFYPGVDNVKLKQKKKH
jgi:hypothetical protein